MSTRFHQMIAAAQQKTNCRPFSSILRRSPVRAAPELEFELRPQADVFLRPAGALEIDVIFKVRCRFASARSVRRCFWFGLLLLQLGGAHDLADSSAGVIDRDPLAACSCGDIERLIAPI
jgi:hypothetical protein